MTTPPAQAAGQMNADDIKAAAHSGNRPERVAWFRDLGLGLFIHWSVDSQLGMVISHSLVGASADYTRRFFTELPKTFYPARFDPDEWARLDDNIIVPTGLWGERSRAWAAGSSTAHFLLSHVVDLLRWYFAPAEVTEAYAISQAQALGFTPDLYDAFLTFDTGLKVRVKAEWIKHIDELVEFYLCFSGRDGSLIYNKRGGFGTAPGWRANVAETTTAEQLVAHQDALLAQGVKVAALLHRPSPVAGLLSAGGDKLQPSLEFRGDPTAGLLPLVGHFINAILEDTLTPTSWCDRGPLPTHLDGLKQTQIVAAIIESAETGRAVSLD